MKRLIVWLKSFDSEDWQSCFGMVLLAGGVALLSVPWALIVAGALLFLTAWAGTAAELIAKARGTVKG